MAVRHVCPPGGHLWPRLVGAGLRLHQEDRSGSRSSNWMMGGWQGERQETSSSDPFLRSSAGTSDSTTGSPIPVFLPTMLEHFPFKVRSMRLNFCLPSNPHLRFILFTHTHHRFLVEVESGYTGRQYHTSIHAADVLRTLHVLCTRGGVWSQTKCSSLGEFAVNTKPWSRLLSRPE